jgi:hypothetical protein
VIQIIAHECMLMIVLERVNGFKNTLYNTQADGRPSLKIIDKGWRRGKRVRERELRNTKRFGRKKRSLLEKYNWHIMFILFLYERYSKYILISII